MSIIPTKADMYALYHAGKFGNRLLTWKTLDDFRASGYTKPVVLRYKGTSGGQWCEYGVPADQVEAVVSRWVKEGARRDLVTVNESADDSQLVIQGEVQRMPSGLEMRYSTLPLPMRKALEQDQKHVRGILAQAILEHYLDPNSMDDLRELLDEYDGAVVEFSTWGHDVGCLPRRNTIFWEVRHY